MVLSVTISVALAGTEIVEAIGNAVPPLIGRAIGQALSQMLEKKVLKVSMEKTKLDKNKKVLPIRKKAFAYQKEA